jgi:hypothetical protein
MAEPVQHGPPRRIAKGMKQAVDIDFAFAHGPDP